VFDPPFISYSLCQVFALTKVLELHRSLGSSEVSHAVINRHGPFSNKGGKTGASLEAQHGSIATRNVFGDNDFVLVAVRSGAGNIVGVEGVVDVSIHENVLIRPVGQQPLPLGVTESIVNNNWNLARLTNSNNGSSVEVTDDGHVILDLHGAPGSQNGLDNSGKRSSDINPNHWGWKWFYDPTMQADTVKILVSMSNYIDFLKSNGTENGILVFLTFLS